jgi:outer membrane protein assembly factor BamB
MTRSRLKLGISFFALALLAAASLALAGEWPSWRGPTQNGIATDTGLPSTWSLDGENLIWRADLIGRSTPVVVDGRVCAQGREGEGAAMRERVACWDAGSGQLLWERHIGVYHTAVPFTRVGWASPAADLETGRIYVHSVGGWLVCYDAKGAVVWSRFLTEDFGHLSGYGGRTQSPVIEGDLLLLSFVSSGWGDQAAPRGRYWAFDKNTGDLVWVSTPSAMPYDMNTMSGIVVGDIGGRRTIVAGDADGWIYALAAATGEKLWSFQFSKGGLNANVLIAGDRVYASHSEENIDAPSMGRVVCIDGKGKGDVTKTGVIWHADEIEAGFPSPLLDGDRLYIVDNSANMFALDAASGRVLWKYNLGTVGKSSPVLADGKVYAPETNGRLHILKLGADGATSLDVEQITIPIPSGHRTAEIYGSPAVAYGRVYLATEAGLFCLGDKQRKFEVKRDAPPAPPRGEAGPAAALQVVPADVLLAPGQSTSLRLRAVDAAGRVVAAPSAEWSVDGAVGTLDGTTFTAGAKRFATGAVVAKAGSLQAKARVRVIAPLPWSEDFESFGEGESPSTWIGATRKFVVQVKDGGKVLVQPVREQGLQRSDTYMGSPSFKNYTIEADVRGQIAGRKKPDIGLINSGYTLDLMGGHQKIQLRCWAAEMGRLSKDVEFPWEMDTWYKMKLQVQQRDGKALVKGKVWPAAAPEPTAWTVEIEDPYPIAAGSPGLIGYAPAEIWYDNLKVTVNE